VERGSHCRHRAAAAAKPRAAPALVAPSLEWPKRAQRQLHPPRQGSQQDLQHQLQLARLSRHSPPNVASCSHCMSTPGSQRPPLHRLSGCHGPLPDLATRINGHQGYAPRPARPMHSPSPKKRSCARLTPPSTIPVGAVTLPCPEPTNHHHLWPDGQAAPTSSAHRGGAMPTSATGRDDSARCPPPHKHCSCTRLIAPTTKRAGAGRAPNGSIRSLRIPPHESTARAHHAHHGPSCRYVAF